VKVGSSVRPGRVPEKKGKDRTGQYRTGQDSQTKKSQNGNISPIWGEAPNVPIETKFCVVGHLADVITYAKFQVACDLENIKGSAVALRPLQKSIRKWEIRPL